jgi:type IX secretion system PorP/SprF family membrane protein
MKINFCLLWLLVPLALRAQDPAQSQFFSQMHLVNPAASGFIPGEMASRVSLFHRSQWAPLRMEAYQAMGVSFEHRWCLGNGHFWSLGGQVQRDGARLGHWNNIRPQVMASYHMDIADELYLSAGFQGGALQTSFDPQNLRFDAQFTATGYQPDAFNGENFARTASLDYDLHAGLLLYHTRQKWVAGLALHHLNRPDYSFLTLADNTTPNRLDLGFTLHGSAPLGTFDAIKKGRHWKAHVLLKKQSLTISGRQTPDASSQQWQLVLGAETRPLFRVSTGAFVRLAGSSPRGWLPDSFIWLFKVNTGDAQIGLSYDVLLSQLGFGNRHNGALELSLNVAFREYKKCVVCPH